MPKITVNLNENDYKNFFLTYQCIHDTHNRYRIKNEECYKAPWVDLHNILENAFSKSIIEKSKITQSEDLELIKNVNITLPDFEHIVTSYSNVTMEELFSSANALYTIPSYETENAGLTFELDKYVENK